MPELKTQLADYFDHVVDRVDVADIGVDGPVGSPPSEAPRRELPASGGADLTVPDLLQPVDSSAPTPQKRWAIVAAAIAAAIVLVVGVSLVDRSNDSVVTEAAISPTSIEPGSSPGPTDPVIPPSVLDPASSYRWSPVTTDDAAVFGEHAEETMDSVTVGGPGLVAAGHGVWTSVDGITWSRVPDEEAIFAHAPIHSVTAGGPGLVAVGVAFGDEDDRACPGSVPATQRSDCAAVWTSVDGLTWSRVPHDEAIFGGAAMTSVTAGGPGLVAVGWDGHPQGGESNAVVWTSPDGNTWARVSHDEAIFGNATGAWMWGVAAGGPGLVAVGSTTGGAAVWTSVDGVTWSRVPHDEAVFGNAEMMSVTAGGPGLVAVGEAFGAVDRPAVWTSVDGATWSRVPHDEAVFGNAGMTSVTAGGPGLVAVGFDGHPHGRNDNAAVWTSVDGVTWSRVPHDDAVFGAQPPVEMRSIIAGGPGLVAVGSRGMSNTSNTSDVALWVAKLEN